ncbi:protoporphyrinogen oxidase HemJ [Methylocella sp.]|uniref:protoporphyrinogen oxidase HemJ n=1 Tax=Methylocella sp. TaxID=1978226 RepID=UPI0037837326
MTYGLVKTLHVLAVISWMAGLLYLPRLFVYHAGRPEGEEPAKTFAVMERRLMKAIMTPAALVAWVSGLWLAASAGFFAAPWLHAKLALVIAMSAVHVVLERERRAFAEGANRRSPRFFRVLNEVPTLLMIFIVALVVLKPF